jgi:FlaA1/EpsC-like NDP-sugar epimerase
MLVDTLIVMESFAVALIVRVSGDAVPPTWPFFLPFAVFAALGFVLLGNWNGVYQGVPRYSESGAVASLYQDVRLLSATAITAGSLFLVVFCSGPFGFGITRVNIVPLSVPLVGSALAYAQLVAVRHIRRVVAER